MVTQPGGPLSFVNLDVVQHDVVAKDKGPDGGPLFKSKLIGLAESAPVEGLEKVQSGQSYGFYCSLHPGMQGTLRSGDDHTRLMCEPRAPRCPMPHAPFADDRSLLLEVFSDVVTRAEGAEAFAVHERTVELARAARGGDASAADQLAELVAGLDLDEAELLVRALTRWFQLINLAEDNERIRRMRARERREGPAPRGARCSPRSGACARRA